MSSTTLNFLSKRESILPMFPKISGTNSLPSRTGPVHKVRMLKVQRSAPLSVRPFLFKVLCLTFMLIAVAADKDGDGKLYDNNKWKSKYFKLKGPRLDIYKNKGKSTDESNVQNTIFLGVVNGFRPSVETFSHGHRNCLKITVSKGERNVRKVWFIDGTSNSQRAAWISAINSAIHDQVESGGIRNQIARAHGRQRQENKPRARNVAFVAADQKGTEHLEAMNAMKVKANTWTYRDGKYINHLTKKSVDTKPRAKGVNIIYDRRRLLSRPLGRLAARIADAEKAMTESR